MVKIFARRIFSFLLVFVMLFTMVPLNDVKASATDEHETEEVITYNATNALGAVIEQAMESEITEGNGYFIQEVSIEELTATAHISAPDDTTLVVAIYDENSGAMVTSGNADIDSQTELAYVLLDECEMPDFFVVKAFLLDCDNAPICKNYEGLEYTAAYQEFLAKTVFDFEEETIVNFDNSYDNNFAVVTDEAVNVEQTETLNILVTNDYENGVYVFENADDTIKSLTSGEVFYYEYGDGEDDYILTKVGTVEIDGDTVTITASDEFEISDFFSYIKIDTSKPYEEISTYAVAPMADYDDEQGDVDYTTTHSISVEKEYKESENVKVSFNGTLKLEFYIKFYYDFVLLGKDYYELTYKTTVSFEGTTEIKAEAEKEFAPLIFFQGGIPVYIGLEAEVEVALLIKLSASIAVSGGIEFKIVNGARKIVGEDKEDLSKKPSVLLKFSIEGKAALNIIPTLSVGLKVLKVFSIKLGVNADFEILATARIININTEESKKHSCALCIDGDISLSVTGNIIFGFGLKRDKQKTILNIDLFSVKKKLGDFYISFIGNSDGTYTFLRFGWGECPNINNSSDNENGGSANTSGEMASGICGDNLTWVLYNDGELVISGSGAMTNWSSYSSVPWYGNSSDIRNVTIGNGATNIGDYAFMDCKSISKVTIGNSVKSIGYLAFGYCNSITNIIIPGSVISIGNGSFIECSSLTSVTIPDSVISIGDNAFWNCGNLTGVVIGNGVTSIGESAFNSCERLINITINYKNKCYSSDVYGVLFDKNKTELIQYPIGNERTSYSIPDSVTSIGEGAFGYCNSLTNIKIPNSVISIGEGAFLECSNLTEVTIPDSVISIGDSAFFACSSLTNATIGNNVSSIGEYAFCGCDSLECLVIGNGVTSISHGAFSVYGLTDVYYTGTKAQWNSISMDYISFIYLTNATIHYNYVPTSTASYMSYSVMRTSAYSATEAFTASADNAVTGNEYLILVLSRLEKEIDLSADNLLYIGQQTATEPTVLFEFIPKSDDIGMVVIIGDFGNGNESVFANEWIPEFTVTWNIDGETVSHTVVFGETITAPDVPEKDGCYFAGWTPAIPSYMPAMDMTFTAKFADYDISGISITVAAPETRNISYRESVMLYANATNLPDGAKIKWKSDSAYVSLEPSTDGKSCVVTSVSDGDAVVTAYIVDANGNVITDKNGVAICDKEGLSSEVNLWLKIVYFFKKLFGLTKTVVQSIYIA